MIERRLSLLSPRARQLVQLAAIAGSGYSIPLAASCAAQDWPNALPAMSNLGVMYYWRGENAAAHEVLASARAQREQLYGGGAGIKIDIHLGGVLYELGSFEEARTLLQGALDQLRCMPPSEYIRTDALLIENYLAQRDIAPGPA